MNRNRTNQYSLSSESPRWWWLSATAGTAGLATVTLLFLLPVGGSQAVPVQHPPEGPATTVQPTGDYVERPCYLARPGWNDWDWEQPVCRTYLRGPSDPTEPFAGQAVVRQGLETLP